MMKKFGLLALISVLIWFAWQMGFQQAKHPGIGFVASEQRVIHSGLSNPAFQQAAINSEHFLVHSARAIQYNSAQAWDNLTSSNPGRAGHAPPTQEPSPTFQSGLARIWRQTGQALSSLQPVAKATWGLLQTGWQNLTQDQTEPQPEKSPRPNAVASGRN
jgi:hypothetical protein